MEINFENIGKFIQRNNIAIIFFCSFFIVVSINISHNNRMYNRIDNNMSLFEKSLGKAINIIQKARKRMYEGAFGAPPDVSHLILTHFPKDTDVEKILLNQTSDTLIQWLGDIPWEELDFTNYKYTEEDYNLTPENKRSSTPMSALISQGVIEKYEQEDQFLYEYDGNGKLVLIQGDVSLRVYTYREAPCLIELHDHYLDMGSYIYAASSIYYDSYARKDYNSFNDAIKDIDANLKIYENNEVKLPFIGAVIRVSTLNTIVPLIQCALLLVVTSYLFLSAKLIRSNKNVSDLLSNTVLYLTNYDNKTFLHQAFKITRLIPSAFMLGVLHSYGLLHLYSWQLYLTLIVIALHTLSFLTLDKSIIKIITESAVNHRRQVSGTKWRRRPTNQQHLPLN